MCQHELSPLIDEVYCRRESSKEYVEWSGRREREQPSEKTRVHFKNGEILPPSNSANGLNEIKTVNFPLGVATGRVAGEGEGGRRQT